MILPTKYKNTAGDFPEHEGKYKLSYSQMTSWFDYHNDYIRGYFYGHRDPSGPYALFGTACGEYLEHKGQGLEYSNPLLSTKDKRVLNKLELEPDSTYEEEIVIDYGDFVLQGFIDKATYNGNKVIVTDFKTGNYKKKKSFYQSDEYLQTTAYCKFLEDRGNEIEASQVILLDRVGNAFRGESLSLTGDVYPIETPYTEERVQLLEDKLRLAAKGISKLYKTYLECLD